MRFGRARRCALAVALVCSTAALPAVQTASPQLAQIDQLIADAQAAFSRGDLTGEVRLATEAAALSRAAGDDARLVTALMRIGEAEQLSGHPAECVTALREADPVAARLPNPIVRAKVDNNLGVCLRAISDFEGAIDDLRRSAQLLDAGGDHSNAAKAQANIAGLYLVLGENAQAEDWAQRAVAGGVASKDVITAAFTLESRGNVEFRLHQSERAVATFAQALRVIASDPRPVTGLLRAELTVNIALAEFDLARYTDARMSAGRALELIQQMPQPLLLDEAVAYLVIGASLYRTGDRAGALDALLTARARWQRVDQTDYDPLRFATEQYVALVMRENGQPADALRIDTAVIAAIERRRAGASVTDTSAATAVATSADAFTQTIDLLCALGRVDEAFGISERYRARTFLDTLDERRNGLGQALTSDERAREAELQAQGSTLQKTLWAGGLSDARQRDLIAQLSTVDDDLDAIHREIRRNDPRYASVRYPELVGADDVRQSLDADTVFVSYVLAEPHSFVWAITSSGVASALLPPRKTIEARVNLYRALIAARPAGLTSSGRDVDVRRDAEDLSRTLLAPILPSLTGKHRIVIVPDGALLALPFEALRTADGTAWLGETYAVSYAPSASALASIAAGRAAAPPEDFIGFGDPARLGADRDGPAAVNDRDALFAPLPYTRVEVERIASLFPPGERRVYVGADAREEVVKREPLDQFRFIHFAAHAFTNDVRPGRSGIVLTLDPVSKEDGVLQADEVMGLHLNADLVTLSACNTALGRVVAGEGVMGLARSFFYAGARSVAASLWSVNDSASADFMEAFYRGLARGAPRDDALLGARRALMHAPDARLHDPYYWAPFILIGSVK